jgi:hypothetical protein
VQEGKKMIVFDHPKLVRRDVREIARPRSRMLTKIFASDSSLLSLVSLKRRKMGNKLLLNREKKFIRVRARH